jgi:RNA polymerase sigma-70 factor (ECF subfamily)
MEAQAPLSDTILQRIAAGDQQAVNECIDTYSDLIWSLARRFLRSQQDAEDVVQDIFIELWSTAERFDPAKAGETTFVAMIARRRIIDRLRKLGRQPDMDDVDDIPLASESVNAPSGETESDVAVVSSIMERLKPEQQNVLQMSIYEGYSHGDIAQRLGMPLGTVKTLIRRGLIQIREELEAMQGGHHESS